MQIFHRCLAHFSGCHNTRIFPPPTNRPRMSETCTKIALSNVNIYIFIIENIPYQKIDALFSDVFGIRIYKFKVSYTFYSIMEKTYSTTRKIAFRGAENNLVIWISQWFWEKYWYREIKKWHPCMFVDEKKFKKFPAIQHLIWVL